MNAKSVAPIIQGLFRDILKEFVLHPDSLEVVVVPYAQGMTVLITAAGRDVGRVIGEKGAHFNALKIIGAAIGIKHGVTVELEPVPDPTEPGKSERYEKFKARDDWPKDKIVALLDRTARAVFRYDESIEVTTEDLSEATTMATVLCASAEQGSLIEPFQNSLKAIFNAVGKANGRTIFVVVTPSKKADPVQPKTAAGRNARAVRR